VEAKLVDRIALRNFRVLGKHGANPGERDSEQPFDIDLAFEIDLQAASQNDNLADTVSYADVHERFSLIVSTTSFALLERLAGALLAELFLDARIARAELTIAKPQLLDGATPSVTLVRENSRWRAPF
jgi:7,8-dihydroneopterin aldolase/epimerase/oxygenase